MSMIYCHKHDRHVDTDFHEGCPECIQQEANEMEISRELKTVLLGTHDDHDGDGTGQPSPRDMWAVATRITTNTGGKVWHVWSYHRDMLEAMEVTRIMREDWDEVMLICPCPDALEALDARVEQLRKALEGE